MLSFVSTAAAVLALCGVSSAAISARDLTYDIELYAYGPGIGGARVFYADGVALLGEDAPAGVSVASNITFGSDLTSDTTPWYAYSNTSLWSADQAPALYIVNTTNAYDPVGFTAIGGNSTSSTNTTVPAGATTVGLTWFGTTVAFVGSDGDYEMSFYATNTTTTGVFNLLWNQANTFNSNAVPVTLKRRAPSRRFKMSHRH